MDIKEENGVKYFFDNGEAATDIEVAPEVEELMLKYSLQMPKSKKSFPNVKKLIIEKDVWDIKIPNTLFPNVREVVSHTETFLSGKYLLKRDGFTYLKNVFCPDKDDTIVLSQIYAIDARAFAGCECVNLERTENIIIMSCCAFDDSGFLKQPFKNGVKMAGSILVDVDYDADEVILPDEENAIVKVADNVDLTKIKKLVIHNAESLKRQNWPKNVVFNAGDKHVYCQLIQSLAHHKDIFGYADVENLEIQSSEYTIIDGIIYTSDLKTVIAGCLNLDKVVIPEGVTIIEREAFKDCMLTSLRLPDSLTTLSRAAFMDCERLRTVELGSGVNRICRDVFMACKSLEAIIISPQVEGIEDYAFSCSGLKSVELNSGLRHIENNAFFGTPMTDIVLPEGVQLSGRPFGADLTHITAVSADENLISAVMERPVALYQKGNRAFVLKADFAGKTAYLPKLIKSNQKEDFIVKATQFFCSAQPEHCDFWQFAYSTKCQENTALLEYLNSGSEDAKKYLKKNSCRIIARLIGEGDEELAVKFLKTGLVSKITLKKLLTTTEEKSMVSIKSYILEQLNSSDTSKENFYI